MKKAFTLVEVLISFSLAIIILSIGASLTLSFFRTKENSTVRFEETLQKHMRRAQLRNILSTMVSIKGRKPLIVSSEGSSKDKKLLFTRNNGIFRNPKLANNVISLLFLNDKGLNIALHGDPSRKDMGQNEEEKVYLLWPKVSTISWEFFGKKNLSSQALEWSDEWKEEETLPLAIRATLSFDDSQTKEIITAVITESIEKKTPLTVEISAEQLEKWMGEQK